MSYKYFIEKQVNLQSSQLVDQSSALPEFLLICNIYVLQLETIIFLILTQSKLRRLKFCLSWVRFEILICFFLLEWPCRNGWIGEKCLYLCAFEIWIYRGPQSCFVKFDHLDWMDNTLCYVTWSSSVHKLSMLPQWSMTQSVCMISWVEFPETSALSKSIFLSWVVTIVLVVEHSNHM